MKHSVVFSPRAETDLQRLYSYIARHDGTERALRYIVRIEAACRKLHTLPMRGTPHDDVRPGLRMVGFERRATIAFSVDADIVTILRVLYGGRDVVRALKRP